MKTLTTTVAVVEDAYALQFAPEALAKLKEIEPACKQATLLADTGAAITVEDDETDAAAKSWIVEAAATKKTLESLRKYFKDPFVQNGKRIDAKFAEWTEALERQDERLRQEAGKLFIKRRDEAAAIERKRLADEAAMIARQRALGRAAPKLPEAVPVALPAATTHTEAGSLNIRTEWVLAGVEDITKVPEKYTFRTVDAQAVAEAIAKGVHQIPGLKIEERARTSARR